MPKSDPARAANILKFIISASFFAAKLCRTITSSIFTDEGELVPCKLVAKCVKTGEEILLFDGAVHGYNAMFCDELDAEKVARRELVKFNLPPRASEI